MTALTIIGRGPSWRECPFTTSELWGTTTCLVTEGLSQQKYTKVFAFDNDNDPLIKESVKVANERGIPVVSTFEFATEVWPSREIVKEFLTSYFLNSISRMLAYAVYLKYTKLFIYGIDQGPTWQLQQSKPHVCFWLGFARAKGIDLRLGRGCLRWAYADGAKPPVEPILDPHPISEALVCSSA